MATATIVQNTGVIPYTPSGAKSKGDIIVTVSRVGIVVRAIEANQTGEMCVEGIALFPKSTSGGSAIPDGTLVYWNDGSSIISITPSDGLGLGTTVGASADADATQSVRMSGSSSSGNFSGSAFSGTVTMANNANFAFNTTNGTMLGTAANQKLGAYGVTPVVQPSGTGELIGLNGNAATAANATNMNSNGNSGTKYYTMNDIVKALKAAGWLAAS